MSKDKGNSPDSRDPLRFQHIKRLVIATFLGFTVLLSAKFLLVPKTFGQYGHYRGAAVNEIRARQPNHIGRAACLECHEEVKAVVAEYKHSKLSCESCHGPMAAHAEEQTDENSKVVFTDENCLRCHQKLAARPRFMHQVDGATHFSKEACASCHAAHNPKPHKSTGIMKAAAGGGAKE